MGLITREYVMSNSNKAVVASVQIGGPEKAKEDTFVERASRYAQRLGLHISGNVKYGQAKSV